MDTIGFYTPAMHCSMACSARCPAHWTRACLTPARIFHGKHTICNLQLGVGQHAVSAPSNFALRAFSNNDSPADFDSQGPGVPSVNAALDPLAAEMPPWMFGFQCNERYLDWDASAQRQLLKIVASDKLGISEEELSKRINQVGILIPGLVSKLEVIKADLLVKLLEDTGELSEKLVVLRDALPGVDISGLVAQFPYIVADNSAQEIQDRIERMQEVLPGVDISVLLIKEPRLFDADLKLVLEEIQRLMGKNADPVALLVARPEMVLSMEQSGLTSAIDIERPKGE